MTRGCWAEDFERASRASAVMRREAIAALGDAVIGLAVPAGQVENFDEGRGEAQRLAKPSRARRVARDMHEDGRLALGSFRQRAREIAGDEGVEPLGRVGEKQLVAGLQSREGGF